jgi:hypothetical protein
VPGWLSIAPVRTANALRRRTRVVEDDDAGYFHLSSLCCRLVLSKPSELLRMGFIVEIDIDGVVDEV